MLIRSDAGGGTKGLIEHIDGYLMGFRGSDAIGIMASTTGKEAKSHILPPDDMPATLATGFIADIIDRVRSWSLQRPPKIGINLDNYPPGIRVIMKAEHPASGSQLTITDVDGRRVRLFVASPSAWTALTAVVAAANSVSKTLKTCGYPNSRIMGSG